MAGSAVLRVHRRQNPWRDRAIDYAVQVDGAAVGKVAMGESQDFVLALGEHDVRLRQIGILTKRPSKLWGSRTLRIAVQEGDLVEVICGPNGPSILAFVLFFTFHRWIKLENPRRFSLR
jgi:hypothetical protein